MNNLTKAIFAVNTLLAGLSAVLLQDSPTGQVATGMDRILMFLGSFIVISFGEAYLLNLVHALSKKRYGWTAAILFLPVVGVGFYMLLKSKRLFPFGG